MIVETRETETPIGAEAAPPPAPSPPRAKKRTRPWHGPKMLLAGLAVLLLIGLVSAVLGSRSSAPAAVATPVTAALIAHGQIVPAQQARVGTQAGGVVQELGARLGASVAAQTMLAVVVGPSGTEIVTAPFSGSVANVLVHVGDTLAPGAPIAVVADLHTLQVETSDVDEFLVGHVSVGQRVQVTVDALDNRVLSGSVSNVALLPQTGTSGNQAYPVIVTLGGLPPEVRAGMSVRITLPE